MKPDIAGKLRRSLVNHEGKENFPYIDTVGKITIGIGYNLSDRGVSDEWINEKFTTDIQYFYDQLSSTFPWFKELNSDRQIALIDMCFMGWKKFLSFKKLIKALDIHDYEVAHEEMLNSKWALQVKGRAITLANAILSGVYNV